jgi:EAL domain-containing protein (putative c-di-GMP-specific phosphodiesterase class I)
LSSARSAFPSSDAPPEDGGISLMGLNDFVSPDELSVVFQPIIAMATGKLFAYEALVRCSRAEFRSPPVLFDRAVEAGCTGRLGRMIREIGVPLCEGVPLFVNIHPSELNEGWLVRPDDPVFEHDEEIYLEVTESVPMTHFDLCMSVLQEVSSRAGVHLVVDDLGAGYSNLLRIADMEPRVVKLDRQLIMGLDTDRRKQKLVTALVKLCASLDADVVAEGIETVGEFKALLDTGAHYGQGYLFARPAFPLPEINWPTLDVATTLAPPTRQSND